MEGAAFSLFIQTSQVSNKKLSTKLPAGKHPLGKLGKTELSTCALLFCIRNWLQATLIPRTGLTKPPLLVFVQQIISA